MGTDLRTTSPSASSPTSPPSGATATTEHRFDVFVSYSRRDSAFARALYKALSSYTPPPGLGLPERRLRVFIDRSDFTGVEYSQAIARHLAEAVKLVVVCSPNARHHSKFVDDEIRVFVEQRGAANVIPVLLAGVPNNEASLEQEAQRAFPEQLCAALAMPLARDFRGFDPGTKRLDKGRFADPWYFLLADIYGRSRAEMERRDQIRRARTQRRLLAGAAVLVAILSGLTIAAFVQRNTAITRLVRSYQSNAQRRVEAGDVPGALLWYTQALSVRDDDLIRVRLAALLGAYPRLVRVFPAPRNGCDFGPDGHRIVCADGAAARIWNVATGAAMSPLLPNGGTITSVSFSADGRRLLTADSSGGARVWEASSGRSIATLALPAPIRQARFTRAGDRIVAAAEDGSMRVWDARGQPVTPVMKHAFPLRRLALSDDGTRIATILDDGTVFPTLMLWDATSGQLLVPPIKRPLPGFSVSFANAHDLLYVHSTAEGLAVCEAASGACRPMRAPMGGLESTSFSADGRRLLAVGADHVVRAYDVQTGEPLGEEMKHGPAVTRALFSPDGENILTSDYNHAVHVWNVAEGKEGRAPIDDVDDAWLSPSGDRVAVNDDAESASSNLRVLNVTDGYAVTVPMRQSQAVREVKFSSDGKYVLAIGTSSWLWELEPNAFRTLPDSAGARVWAAGFDRSRRALLLVGDERSVRLWDAKTARPITPPMQHANRINEARIVGSASRVITQSLAGGPGQRSTPVLMAWDATTGQTAVAPLDGARLYHPLQMSRDGQGVIVRMEDGHLRVWSLAARGTEPMTELPAQARAVTFTSSGVCSAVAVAGGSDLRISNGVSGTPLGLDLKGVGDAPQVQLAPDCQRVATIGEDEQLRIWDTRTGRFVLPRREDADPFGFFQSATFSPDGESVATQANDGTARVWSAETGAPRTQPLGRLEFIRDIAFTADGRYVTASGHGLTAMVWDAATGERLAEFRDAPFLLAGDGIVAWSADGRRAIAVANAYLKDVYRQDVVVRVHSLDPDRRDVEMLSTLAQLVSGRRIDESGSFVSLTRSELRSVSGRKTSSR